MRRLLISAALLLMTSPVAATVAFDATSDTGQTTGNFAWDHTPVGTPKGIIVAVVQSIGSTDEVTSITHGGDSMTEATGSPHCKSNAESGCVYIYYRVSSVKTGAQEIFITVNGTGSDKKAYAMSVTATGDTSVVDTDVDITSDSVSNPTGTLSLGGSTSFCAIAFYSGQDAVGGIAPNSGWGADSALEHSFGGNDVAGWYSYDTVASSDVTIGWQQTADDAIGMGIALADTVGGVTGNAGIDLAGVDAQ
jgi:hypothetical protein